MNEKDLARFYNKIIDYSDPEKCWIWKGYISGWGYGNFTYKGKHRYAHQASYEHFVGPIPDGLQIDHICRNKLCVNWRHLEAVTKFVNALRVKFYNSSKTHCKRGHELSAENTYIYTKIDKRTQRQCKECRRIYMREYRRTSTLTSLSVKV